MTKAINISDKTIFGLTLPQLTSLVSTVVVGVVAFMNLSNRLSFVEKTYVSEASLRTILSQEFDGFEDDLKESIVKEIQFALSKQQQQ